MLDQLPRPAIFAHRGASSYAPENTLAAFQLAVQQGADGIELDAKLSSDGIVVVIHDQSVDRTTDGTGQVASLPLAALQELDAGSWYGPDFASQRIPTLQQVFESIDKQMIINIELTNYASLGDQLPEKAAALVKAHNRGSQVFFSSFNPWALVKASRTLPETPRALLTLKGVRESWLRAPFGRMLDYQAHHPDFQDVNPEMLAQQHERGCRVHAYTVNQAADMRQLFGWGIDGIFTDDVPLAQQQRAEVRA